MAVEGERPDRLADSVFSKEALQRLGCSQDTLSRWIKNKLAPQPLQSYPGRRLAWRRADFERFIQEMR
jgi:predicted DNA-binding transcriptional regulator AlpA